MLSNIFFSEAGVGEFRREVDRSDRTRIIGMDEKSVEVSVESERGIFFCFLKEFEASVIIGEELSCC